MNELCRNETGITKDMDDTSVAEFCESRSENVLLPYCPGGGKADVLFVPGNNELGATMARALTLFGEHDGFMEITYPLIMNAVVPKEGVLEMPLCDNSINKLKGKYDENVVQSVPLFQATREEGKGLDCPVIHPIKFGKDASIAYWKGVINDSSSTHSCSWCTWKDAGNNLLVWLYSH
jgi:hypothetical protein